MHFLENDAVTIDGVRFLGATLWTDFLLFGEDQKPAAMREAARVADDFQLIKANWLPLLPPPSHRGLARAGRHGGAARQSLEAQPCAHAAAKHPGKPGLAQGPIALGGGGQDGGGQPPFPSVRSLAPQWADDLVSAIYGSNRR